VRLLSLKRLILSGLLIFVVLSVWSCTSESDNDGDVLIFNNPPESQRTIGTYSPSVAAQPLIELDHYMLGIREDPRLHITYTNISNDTVQIEIGIMWLWSEERLIEIGYQHDVREPILPGQTETLVYRPLVESPSDIIDYCIEVHSLLTERLPHVSLGPQVGPEESVRTPGQMVSSTITLEKANLDEREIEELRHVVSEVLEYAEWTASSEERELLDQGVILVNSISSATSVKDILREKTEEERFLLDVLGETLAAGLQYWGVIYGGVFVPSPVGEKVAEGTEELGNSIAEWLWMGDLSLLRLIDNVGSALDIVYDGRPGEIWVTMTLNEPMGHIYLYIPVKPTLSSLQGKGRVDLSNGVNPIMDECLVTYKFSDD
jgi:hypothetical protein